jgi:hypothetical protein
MRLTRLFFPSTSCLFNRLAQVAASLLLVAGLVGGAGLASAQPSPTLGSAEAESVSAQWLANFDLQAAHLLREAPANRAALIEVLIHESSEREDLALPQTASALLYVIENSESRKDRMMAVQALSEIAPEQVGEARYDGAMSQLYALGEEESSERVRKAIADAIISHQTS